MHHRLAKKLTVIVLISLAIVLSFSLRLVVSQIGFNNDMRSWWDVSSIILSGKVVYNSTQFYNYGPIWSYILGGLRYISNSLGLNSILQFHLLVVLFLSSVDLLISALLYKSYGKMCGILYMLNPISVLITGFHSQFDNLAVLLGLIAWLYYLRHTTTRSYLVTALLLGLSITTKHILIFFPIWIVFINDGKKLREKIAFVAVALSVFIAGFVIELIRDHENYRQILNGIKLFVLEYKGSYGVSALTNAIGLFIPPTIIKELFNWVPILKGYTFVFFMLLSIYGFIFIRRCKDTKLYFPVYLLVFFALSPSMADQYLAIPLLAYAILYKHIEVLLITTATFAYLAAGPSANISNFTSFNMRLGIGNHSILMFPWSLGHRFVNTQTQALALLFSVKLLFNKKGTT